MPSSKPVEKAAYWRLTRSLEHATWMDTAECREAPVDLWYSSERELPDARDTRVEAAKAICRSCHARQPCLETAIANREPHGIWGGLTATERRLLMREIRRARTA